MDPQANKQEQRSLARAILALIDACADDGSFTAGQTAALLHHGARLAELVDTLADWEASR